jgi:DNA-binding winged helix-turn-helix (wHTH) protein
MQSHDGRRAVNGLPAPTKEVQGEDMGMWRFGHFELDTSTGELRKNGYRVRLRPQPCAALAYLVERQGQFVSRQELSRALWPEGTFVHFDHGLNSCIKQIRAALGDSRTAPRYVETLTRRGYRFIAPVMLVASDNQRVPRVRLRAMPVRVLDADRESTALAEGLGEELVAQLATAAPPDMLVMASVSPATCSDAEAPPADFVLQATIRTAGNRVRVTTQLIDARERCHVWAGRFDGSLEEPIDAQSAAAESIVSGVIATLGNGCDPGGESDALRSEPHRAPLTLPRVTAFEKVS